MPDVGAVVLAGGRSKGGLLEASGQPHRALIEVAGRPILTYVLDALRASRLVGRAVVVAPAECRDIVEGAGVGFDWLPAGDTMVDNLLGGAAALPDSMDALVAVAGDMPFLTGASVDQVVETALRRGDAFCYPITPRAACEKAFPGVRRTYAKLRDGVYTGGNVVVVSRRLLLANRETIVSVYGARKSPLKLAMMLGFWTAVRLPFGRVSIAEAERRAARMLGFPVSAMISEDACLAVDVDKASDLALANEVLGVPEGG